MQCNQRTTNNKTLKSLFFVFIFKERLPFWWRFKNAFIPLCCALLVFLVIVTLAW